MSNRKVWVGKTGRVICFGKCHIKYEQLCDHLEKEHFLETDPTRTHSGAERYWVFELHAGTALVFRYHDSTEELYVGSNQILNDSHDIAFQFVPVILDHVNGLMWN